MPTNILMPALSPTMEKGNLARWLKKEGDKIKSGDIIAEIETDKATMEYEAVDEGTLAKIVVPEGTQNVAVNAVIAVLAAEGEDVKVAGAKSAPAAKPATAPAKPAAPSVAASPPVAAKPAAQPVPVQSAGANRHVDGGHTLRRASTRALRRRLLRFCAARLDAQDHRAAADAVEADHSAFLSHARLRHRQTDGRARGDQRRGSRQGRQAGL